MTLSKQEVTSRRTARLFGLFGGLLIYGITRGMDRGSLNSEHHSVFFGNTKSWPKFVQGFWPLDLAEVCLCFWLVIYLMLTKMSKIDEDEGSIHFFFKLALGLFLAFGAIGGVIGSCLMGWYTGLEFFVAMGVGMLVIGGGFALLGFTLFLAATFLGECAQLTWPRLKTKSLLQPVVRFGRYMNGDDIPDDTKTEGQDQQCEHS